MKSWNEIRKDATKFAHRWKGAYDEKSQAQSFLKEFFDVFGIDTVVFNAFEHRVKFTDGSQGYADCFWQGRILIEMKSRGRDLDAAYAQAMEYVRTLPPADYPHAVVVSDFQRFRFYDLEKDNALTEFRLKDLRKYVTLFGYMIGAEQGEEIREQNPVNRKAAEKMAALHDAMKAVGYEGHPLEVYLVRLLFCLFAEDTGIFKPGQFSGFVKTRTSEDGRDLAPQLALLFDTLNREKRLSNLDESIASFPYVNGGLFAESLPFASFSSGMRRALLECGELDWSKISPAIFGAMFQGVMDEKSRHDLGAHYTSEENILKLIRPLFLDALREEFDNICAFKGRTKEVRLRAFHDKIAALTFLDPACGCGNFLLIAYRELRRLEMDVLEELHADDPSQFMDVSHLLKVSVAQFHGIEIEPFPAEIAKVALWLMDHLCNMEVAERFGQYFARIPIKESAHVVCANALTMDWPRTDFIMGNPPFIGASMMSAEQKSEAVAVFGKGKRVNSIDYVGAWYYKAASLMRGSSARAAFVSTNSITQGEQVAPLWRNLGAEIDFAYRTFKWHNEARGVAAVHCVIIGFHIRGAMPPETSGRKKTIYGSDGTEIPAGNINAYLIDAPDAFVEPRQHPLCEVPRMTYGNKPSDGGNLVLTESERAAILRETPGLEPHIRRYVGSRDFINSDEVRYCLWLRDVPPSLYRANAEVMRRLAAVKEMRFASTAKPTRVMADTPYLFFSAPQTDDDYLLIPEVSSERRKYVPMGFMAKDTIAANTVSIVPSATLYHFGVVTSAAHMAWMRAVAGRLKSDYRYSANIVYNNFVWPSVAEGSDTQARISEAAQAVLDARSAYPNETLASLYDPLTMPPDLVKAHSHLDALVDKAYGLKPSATDAERVALLFRLYAAKVMEKGEA